MNDDTSELLRYILDEVRALREDMSITRSEIAALKVKAGVWGILGGILTGLFAYLFEHGSK